MLLYKSFLFVSSVERLDEDCRLNRNISIDIRCQREVSIELIYFELNEAIDTWHKHL